MAYTSILPTKTSHTYVLDPESPTEMVRLMVQDRLITLGMGGLFPEHCRDGSCILPENIRSILDVGCGSGGWVLDVAHAYPDASMVGIDISCTMVDYNRAQAMVQRLYNVTFSVMDALQPLKFATGTFDLVNVRFATAFVPRDQWNTLLQNCLQVLRPGGILRVTEGEIVGLTTSPSVEKVNSWAAQMLKARGYGFSPDGSHIGILPMLGLLLQEAGCVNIQFMPHMLDFSTGTAGHSSQYQNYMVWPLLIKSVFIRESITTEEEFDHTYKLMLEEIQLPHFRGLWSLLTVWGEKRA
jgi:SAM-dependent methyltransferase